MRERIRTLLVFLIVGLTCPSLTAQLDKTIRHTVKVPDGAVYKITFREVYQLKGAKTVGGNVIEIEGPGGAFFRIKDFSVTGPDKTVADAITATLDLPANMSGTSMIGLSNASNSLKSGRFNIENPGTFKAGTDLIVKYNGKTLDRLYLNLSRVFRLKAPVVATNEAAPPVSREVEKPVVNPPPPPKPEIKPKKAVVETVPAWEKDFKKLSARAFVDEWPGRTNYVNQALRKIDLKPIVKEVEPNVYLLTFDYVRGVSVDSITGGDDYVKELDQKRPPYGHEIKIRVTGAGNYRVYVSDATKNKGMAVVELNNLLGGEIAEMGDSVRFTFRGGVPPYQLLFLNGKEDLGFKSIGSDTVWDVSVEELRELTQNRSETVNFELNDRERAVIWDFEGADISLPKKVKPPLDHRLPWLAGGLVALLAVLLLIRRIRKKKRASRIRENLAGGKGMVAEKTSSAPAAAPKNAGSVVAKQPLTPSTPALSKSLANGSSSAPVPEVTHAAPTGGFRVTRRAKVDNHNKAFHPDERPADFLPLQLERNWKSSRVETVLFNKQAIFVLDDFLRRENTSKIANSGARATAGGWERNEAIPEIGGMLMGQYRLGPDGETYRVSVEEFIPLEAKEQNVVRVQIDPLSLARDLGRAQDEHPELTVVGWFHTHPGHGLFLSQPDLKVQYGQFREPYHFAMEIDSLTENLDTAFFTYLPDGTMNNRGSRRPDTPWFSWSEIEKFTRR